MKGYPKKIKRKCLYCGKKYFIQPYRLKTNNYCSAKCSTKDKTGKKLRKYVVVKCKFFEAYERDVLKYTEGKCDGVKLRQETAAAAVFAKKQQSRSAMAMIKYDREKKGYVAIENAVSAKQIAKK